MAAYVYVIEEKPHPEEKTGPWIKIGYTKNPPEWRLNANLKRGNPRDLRLYSFEFASEQSAQTAEQAAHKAFHAHRHRKEWFRIPSKRVRDWLGRKGGKYVKYYEDNGRRS